METWSYAFLRFKLVSDETSWTALLRHINFWSSVFYRQPARVHHVASEAMSAFQYIFSTVGTTRNKLHEKNRNVWPGQLVPLRLKFFRQVELSSCTATTLTNLSISNAAEHCGCRESFEREPSNMNQMATVKKIHTILWIVLFELFVFFVTCFPDFFEPPVRSAMNAKAPSDQRWAPSQAC